MGEKILIIVGAGVLGLCIGYKIGYWYAITQYVEIVKRAIDTSLKKVSDEIGTPRTKNKDEAP